MNLFQLFFLASCMKIIVLASDSPSEDRGKLSIDKKYTKKYFKKRYLTFDGSIKVVGDAKLVGIACFPNTKVKHEDGRLFIKEFIISCKHFFMRWAPDSRSYDADKFYTLAEASYNDGKRGECNAKWESTAEMKDMPNYLKSALESRNIAEDVTTDRFKSFMNMYFILHRCDPIPGRFLCENAVEAHHVKRGHVTLLSDFYKPSDKEASPKCPDYKDESKFYQMPLSGASLARSLLVGCQGEMLWTDLYRIRMFPQFENLLKEKDASCTVGHASKAEMKVNIVLNECDVLSGAFQCAIVGKHKRSGKSVILRGIYELKDTVASKPEPGLGCTESKGKSAKADASVSLTAAVKSRKKGKSAGYRTVPEDTLVAEYNKIMLESFNIKDFGMAKVVYRDIKGSGKRKINIECRLSPKFIQNVKTVSAFFIFYQPFSNIHQARHLLVGYSQDILWAQPYRIRMFPQFKTMLQDKSATCTADKANIAHMKVDIVLNECDALSGGFQCAIVAEVKKRHEGHNDGSVKFEILRGLYKLRETSASKPSPKCKSWSDASYRITPARNVGESAGYRIHPGGGWMLTLGILLLISSSF